LEVGLDRGDGSKGRVEVGQLELYAVVTHVATGVDLVAHPVPEDFSWLADRKTFLGSAVPKLALGAFCTVGYADFSVPVMVFGAFFGDFMTGFGLYVPCFVLSTSFEAFFGGWVPFFVLRTAFVAFFGG
jgi:hypothetical protein